MAVELRGRERELGALLDAGTRARSGQGGAIVVLGEPGMGVSALLNAVDFAGFQVLRTSGVAPEQGIPLAGLHRLLQPLDDRAASVFEAGSAPRFNAFTLCTAVHRLLVELAPAEPLLCHVDDIDLVDRRSVEALAFAARRLAGSRVLMLFGATPPAAALAGIPSLVLAGLAHEPARQVLADRVPLGMPEDLVEELIELAGGNPLALVELAGALTAAQLAGEAPAPTVLPLGSRLRERSQRLYARLSPAARRLVMLSVVDDQLEVDTLQRAGVDLEALEEAKSSGLLRVDGERVWLPSPLARSTLGADAPVAERQAAHQLLARVLDPERHPLRWTWQRVAAGLGSPRRLAEELDDAAGAARLAGDFVGSARAYQRAAELSGRPEAKALRLIAAATDASLAGRTRQARALLRQAAPLAMSDELRGLADLLQGEIELRTGMPALANETLLNAAGGLASSRRKLAVTALMLAADASCIAGNYRHYLEVVRRAGGLRRADEPPATRLMLDHLAGMAATYAGRHEDAAEPLRRVVALAEDTGHAMSKIWAAEAAFTLGDAGRAQELATRAVSIARGHGFLALLPWAFVYVSMGAMLHDRHVTAMSSSLEGMRVAGAIGQRNCVVDHLTILALLAGLLGDRETALLRLAAATDAAGNRGLGRPSALSSWAVACADLADDRPADAMDRLRLMAAGTGYLHPAIRAMATPHFVEAAARCGDRASAVAALEPFDHWARVTGSAPRLAQSHRCHALLASASADADEHFREAIRLHRASNTALELAKTELFYAHQLRRSRKPRAAREHLRDALKIFQQYEADLWARRTRAELRAAGDPVSHPGGRPTGDLTPQQQEIARLVTEGATNREIAATLVISPRTVDHHLRNIFAKLGVRSRVELAALLR
jgi:DNA-binding NarL/FixJ family response regulator